MSDVRWTDHETNLTTRRAIYGRRDFENQFSTVSPLKRAKSGVFAVTNTRAFTGRHNIRVANNVDRDAVFNDLFARLAGLAG